MKLINSNLTLKYLINELNLTLLEALELQWNSDQIRRSGVTSWKIDEEKSC